MKKVTMILWIIIGVVFLFVLFIILLKKNDYKLEIVKYEKSISIKEWKVMTFEEKDGFPT